MCLCGQDTVIQNMIGDPFILGQHITSILPLSHSLKGEESGREILKSYGKGFFQFRHGRIQWKVQKTWMTTRETGIVWKGKSDGKSSVTSGLFPSQSPSDLQSFSSMCFNVCLHTDIAFLFSGVNPEEYRSPFEECLVQFIILVLVW